MRNVLFMSVFLAAGVSAAAQAPPDTAGLYGEKRDSLAASVVQASAPGNFRSRGSAGSVEVITSSGLYKMACCNLADSFENSASVSVGYTDAVTGARQIRLLGQSGIYTQMLDETRPTMRGIGGVFGLNHIPSQWLESISTSKGVSSVLNDNASITGQINLEYRKPTDEKPLFLQASVMSDTRADFNVVSSLQPGRSSRLGTVMMGHISGNFVDFDHNRDGFLDDPRGLVAAAGNRWRYESPSGVLWHFGANAVYDRSRGGQMPSMGEPRWKSAVENLSLGGYAKMGVPLSADLSRNFAVVADYTYHELRGRFGAALWHAGQHSAFVNLLFQHYVSDVHHYTLGLSETFDFFWQAFNVIGTDAILSNTGVFGEYTFTPSHRFTMIAALRADWYYCDGVKVTPRLTLRWEPWEQLVLRANGGRGLRHAFPLADNIGVLSTSKFRDAKAVGMHLLEDAWTFGGSASWYLPFDKSGKTVLSFDYFHTRFTEQGIWDNSEVDYRFYSLSSVAAKGKKAYSYAHNFQVDLSAEPLRGFTLAATFRYTDARQTRLGRESDIKPMTSLWKGVLNLQYATAMRKWIFDLTLSVNGPCKVWEFMEAGYEKGRTPVYPLLFAQVTKRFRGFDLYIGGENLTNFTQRNPIIHASDPWDRRFDASCIWGPLMGAKVYAGVRFTLWKT